MSRKHVSETPNTPYVPATGVPSPAPKNQALVEERSKSNTHQINDLKPVVDEIHTMSKTMVELIGAVRHTNENVEGLNERVESITSSIGTAALAGILSLLTSIAGLPEVQ